MKKILSELELKIIDACWKWKKTPTTMHGIIGNGYNVRYLANKMLEMSEKGLLQREHRTTKVHGSTSWYLTTELGKELFVKACVQEREQEIQKVLTDMRPA